MVRRDTMGNHLFLFVGPGFLQQLEKLIDRVWGVAWIEILFVY